MLLRAVRLLLRAAAILAAVLLVLLAAGWGVGRVLIRQREPDRLAALPAGIPGRLLSIKGHPVHVVERGEGPPLVLVHGFAGSTFDWEERLLEQLARDHRAIAIDLFGMGFSARDAALPYGFDLWAWQLRETLDALGLRRAAVAGHSLGGAVATLFAARQPERVERLVLVAPLVPYDRSQRLDFFAVLGTPGAGEAVLGCLDHLPSLPGFSPAYEARAHAIFRLHGTRDALLRYLRHGKDFAALDAALRRLVVPTVFVLGTADDTVPYAAQREAATRVRDAFVLPVDGVGHWLLRDAPERVAEAIRARPDAHGN